MRNASSTLRSLFRAGMNRADNAKDWVRERAYCSAKGTLCQIGEAIQADVRRFNKLPAKLRRDETFLCEHKEYEKMYRVGYVKQGSIVDGESVVRIVLSGDSIDVFLVNDLMFRVEPKWNGETCDLCVGGEVLPLWRISQKAIGDLLFEVD